MIWYICLALPKRGINILENIIKKGEKTKGLRGLGKDRKGGFKIPKRRKKEKGYMEKWV